MDELLGTRAQPERWSRFGSLCAEVGTGRAVLPHAPQRTSVFVQLGNAVMKRHFMPSGEFDKQFLRSLTQFGGAPSETLSSR
jgi:hypothetical protein